MNELYVLPSRNKETHLNADLKALVIPITFCWNMFLQTNSYKIYAKEQRQFFSSETEMIRGRLLWKLFFLEEKFYGV